MGWMRRYFGWALFILLIGTLTKEISMEWLRSPWWWALALPFVIVLLAMAREGVLQSDWWQREKCRRIVRRETRYALRRRGR